MQGAAHVVGTRDGPHALLQHASVQNWCWMLLLPLLLLQVFAGLCS
jgi:hypothetical protein